jgi:hypothetical protein
LPCSESEFFWLTREYPGRPRKTRKDADRHGKTRTDLERHGKTRTDLERLGLEGFRRVETVSGHAWDASKRCPDTLGTRREFNFLLGCLCLLLGRLDVYSCHSRIGLLCSLGGVVLPPSGRRNPSAARSDRDPGRVSSVPMMP